MQRASATDLFYRAQSQAEDSPANGESTVDEQTNGTDAALLPFTERLSEATGVEVEPLTPPVRRAVKSTLLDATPTGTAQDPIQDQLSPIIHRAARRSSSRRSLQLQQQQQRTLNLQAASGLTPRASRGASPAPKIALGRPLQNGHSLSSIAAELRCALVLGYLVA